MEENVQLQAPTVRSVGMKYGLISGLIGIVGFLIVATLGLNPFQGAWNWIGIAISIALMFFAQKNFKDSGDGFMSYGQGVGIGFWFILISTALSVSVMYVYLAFMDSAPMELFYEEQAANMSASGQSDEAIDVAMEWTKKLFWLFAVLGSIFWGMIIALILTIFTQKNKPEQTF